MKFIPKVLFSFLLITLLYAFGVDEAQAAFERKAKVSSNDTTAGYLNGKLVAGSNVTLTENNDGGNETLTIAATGSVGDSVSVDSVAVTDPNFASTGDIDFVDTSNTVTANINSGAIVNADINASAAIAYSKLASLTSGNILVGNGSNVATSVTMSGDIAIDNAGATTVQNNSVDGTDIALGSDAQGDIMYYNGTDWVALPKGTAGQVLEMNAGATAPEWDTDDGGGGAGDISDVGPACSDGACFTDGKTTTGTTMLVWEGTSADTIELNIISPSANPVTTDIDITLPSATGTLATLAGTETLTNKTLAAANNVIEADTGDSATSFFSAGTIEDARLPSSMADKVITGSLAIPQGTGPTVDAAGEAALDTTASDLLVYDGSAVNVHTSKKLFSYVIGSPSASNDPLIFKARYPITISDIHCIVDPADSSESVLISVDECDATGDNCTTTDANITCDNDGAEDDGTFTNGTIDAGDWVRINVGTVTGTVTNVTVTAYHAKDRE